MQQQEQQEQKQKPFKEYILYFDGGSRGNPGPAGSGSVILEKNATGGYAEIWTDSYYVGDRETNNVAEYTGLLRGLQEAAEIGLHKPNRWTIRGDSLLVIKQIKGEYQVRAPNLQPLHAACSEILRTVLGPSRDSLQGVVLEHVARKGNARADELANRAMDLGAKKDGPK